MEKLSLKQIAEQEHLQVVNVDSKDYVIGDMKNYFYLAEEHHLRINILMKDENRQQNWMLLPYYTLKGLFLENIILNYFKGEYQVVSFISDYKTLALRYIDNFIKKDASPIEVEKAIADTKAIERMFEVEKLGYRKPFALVVDTDCTEHIIVPTHCNSSISFKGITLAVALSVPTKEETDLAICLVKAGKPIPCLNGMMPEDINSRYGDTIDGYDFNEFGEEGEQYMQGPYIIIDDEHCIGYSWRQSWDGVHWFWVEGNHSNHTDMKRDVFEKHRNSELSHLLEKSANECFVKWMEIGKNKTDNYDTLFQLPT